MGAGSCPHSPGPADGRPRSSSAPLSRLSEPCDPGADPLPRASDSCLPPAPFFSKSPGTLTSLNLGSCMERAPAPGWVPSLGMRGTASCTGGCGCRAGDCPASGWRISCSRGPWREAWETRQSLKRDLTLWETSVVRALGRVGSRCGPVCSTKLCVLGYTRWNRSWVSSSQEVGDDLTPSFLGGARSCGRRQVVPTTLSRRNCIWKESPTSFWKLSRGGRGSGRRPCRRFGEVMPPLLRGVSPWVTCR